MFSRRHGAAGSLSLALLEFECAMNSQAEAQPKVIGATHYRRELRMSICEELQLFSELLPTYSTHWRQVADDDA
jgi:hypothetical protein